MRQVAFLNCRHGSIKLDSNLRWQAESELVRRLANVMVPPRFSEDDGDPHAFLINKLKDKLGGEVVFAEE